MFGKHSYRPGPARLGHGAHIERAGLVGEGTLPPAELITQPRSCPGRGYNCPRQLLLRLSNPCRSGARSMVLGRWSCRAPLRHCPAPQNSIMKAPMLVGVLVAVGFAVGRGECSQGQEGGVGCGPGCTGFVQGWDLGVSAARILSSSVPAPELRTCHLCLLEDPSAGCLSGLEKCTISSSSPCMVITVYYSEFKTRGRAAGETAHCLVS